MKAISVRGLRKAYGELEAVRGVDFDIEEGEVFGLLGPNGAGKTTTLRMIAGFLPPTAGRVTLADLDIAEKPLLAKHALGYLPETLAIYPEMRVREYVAFRAELCGVGRRDVKSRVGEALAKCFIDDVAEKPVGNLSKGYKQRVGLAGALVHKPKVLVLDEPTSARDPHSRHASGSVSCTVTWPSGHSQSGSWWPHQICREMFQSGASSSDAIAKRCCDSG